MPVVNPPKNKPALPATADECREDLETLKGDLALGKIDTSSFTLHSARLVKRIEVLGQRRKRFALT